MKQDQEKVPAQLQVALDEIRSVLKKHNMAGIAVIHCPSAEGGAGFCGHVTALGPTYSCVELNAVGELVIRELPPRTLVGDDPDLPKKQVVRNTLNLLFNLRQKATALINVLLIAEGNLRLMFDKGRLNGQQPRKGDGL